MVFTPIELTNENVDKIFNEIAVEENERSTPVRLYAEDNEPNVDLDFEGLKAHSKDIAYICGQLKSVHTEEQYIKLPDIAIKYNGKSWVKDKASFMKLFF